jgi:hypothetical protein
MNHRLMKAEFIEIKKLGDGLLISRREKIDFLFSATEESPRTSMASSCSFGIAFAQNPSKQEEKAAFFSNVMLYMGLL